MDQITTIRAHEVVNLLKANIQAINGIDLQENDSLIASGLIDSFEFMQFLSVLESAFELQLALDMLDFEAFETPASIASMLTRMKSRSQQAGGHS